ncbi:hypothetical protein FOL47_002184 [Perkinsus chesapeaki]|uniref:Uncharacterized protein n=1 Tax=Perkinsus chesapeaki TaxID=330153 RepID=A0A7J6MEV2_PERCH|nr:hypothetical protein FOL47_002184 [Perkinsus chesapeaki]
MIYSSSKSLALATHYDVVAKVSLWKMRADALHRAQKAADETFLVKPVNQPMPQALKSSRLLVVHNDAVARAVSHIKQAMRAISPYIPKPDDARGHIQVVSEMDLNVCSLAISMIPLHSAKRSDGESYTFI